MLRKSIVLLLLVSLAAGILLVVSGCGPSAEQIAKDAMRADEKIKSAHFVIEFEQTLPRAPIQNGTVAKQRYTYKAEGDSDSRTGDWRVTQELASGVPVTGLWVDNKYYVQLAGNWYLMPESMQPAAPVSQTLSTSQYLKYFTSLRKLGDAKVEGEACYHLQGIPNMKDLIKLPGITDLLKDPATGQQLRTVDDLADLKGVFDFYIRKKDSFLKRSTAAIEMRANQDIIQLGYAEAGDRVKLKQATTESRYNENLNLKAPIRVQPWPGGPNPAP